MIAAIALHIVKLVRNRQRRQHSDFLRVYSFCHVGYVVHFFVHELREFLHILHIQFPLDGIHLPENLHFHRPAHVSSMREDNTKFARLACRPSYGKSHLHYWLRSVPCELQPVGLPARTIRIHLLAQGAPHGHQASTQEITRLAATPHPGRAAHRPEAERVAAAVAPQLTYRGGPLLTAVEVFTIFWGAEWNQSPQSVVMKNMNLFFDYILTSALMDQLGEYSVPGKNIGHGTRAGTTILTSPAPSASVQDSTIQQLLQQEIASKHLPAPNPNSLYFVFLPPGVKVVQGGAASCRDFCGYHDSISGNIFYAVMPYTGCSGCTGGLTVADALTSTSSHELCEAITDPVPGQGWYDDNNGEIGDICAWKTRVLGGYTIQLEWRNHADLCVQGSNSFYG